MKSRLPIIAFYVAIILLVILSIAIAYKLVFLPPCIPTKSIPCPVTDAGSIAGVAATVMGVAATVLALLGAFAVAAWWNQLDERVTEIFTKRFEPEMKALDNRLTIANDELQKFVKIQDKTISNIDEASRALLFLVIGNRLLERRKIKAAIDEFQKAKQLQPDDAQVNYILGESYRKIGSYDKAIDCLETAIAAEKEFALAHFELGMAYRSQADFYF